MSRGQRVSAEFKEAVVKKLLSRGNLTVEQFCEKNNLAYSTVNRWNAEYANVENMNHKKNKIKFSAEQILKFVSETHSLTAEDLGLYLRKNGLHTNQLIEWRNDILSSMNQPKVKPNKKDERDLKIKELERNLKRKDSALAEASALLILQKKIQLLWPMPPEDEDT